MSLQYSIHAAIESKDYTLNCVYFDFNKQQLLNTQYISDVVNKQLAVPVHRTL